MPRVTPSLRRNCFRRLWPVFDIDVRRTSARRRSARPAALHLSPLGEVAARSAAGEGANVEVCSLTRPAFAEPVIGRRFAPTGWLRRVDLSQPTATPDQSPQTNRMLFEARTRPAACQSCHAALNGFGFGFERLNFCSSVFCSWSYFDGGNCAAALDQRGKATAAASTKASSMTRLGMAVVPLRTTSNHLGEVSGRIASQWRNSGTHSISIGPVEVQRQSANAVFAHLSWR